MFTLIPNDLAGTLIMKHSGKDVQTFSSNQATAFHLTNGTYIIVPLQGDSSMLFESERAYKDFLENPQFPTSNFDPIFRHQRLLAEIPANIKNFRSLLPKKIFNENEIIEKQLDTAFAKINAANLAEEEFYNELYVPLGVIIGQWLANKHNLHWEYDTIYAFVPYRYPQLKSSNGLTLPLWNILDDFIEERYFDYSMFMYLVDLFLKSAAILPTNDATNN